MRIRSAGAYLALVAGMSVALAGCGQLNQVRAMKAFKDGNKLYASNDFRGAAAKYEEAVAADPAGELNSCGTSPGCVYFYLANSYDNLYRPARKGEPNNDALLTKAVENYKLASEKISDPMMKTRSLEYLVAAYGPDKLNDPTHGRADHQGDDSTSTPTEPTNYFMLARLYEDSGEYEMAEQTLLQAKDAKPNDPAVYLQLAGFYNRQGDFPKTIEYLNERIKIEPNNPEAHYTVATYYWDKAYRDFRLADKEKIAVRPGRPGCGRQGHRHQERLHGGDRLQEPPAPPPGQPGEGPEEAAGTAEGSRPAARQGQRAPQAEDRRHRLALQTGPAGSVVRPKQAASLQRRRPVFSAYRRLET